MNATATLERNAAATLERLEGHARAIREGRVFRGDQKVGPGMPERFSEACTVGDEICQGDLNIFIVDSVPKNYIRIERLEAKDLQLVPGNTQGAKHCLDSLDGVTMYRPPTWNEDSLDGPYLVLTKERTILHPVHGDVTIPAGFTVGCEYEREYDKEMQKERRARD